MKALTLTQPWATLVAIGAKRIETRSWSTTYRGPLAIHAGKGPSTIGWPQLQHMCRREEPFKSTLGPVLNGRHPAEVLPLGAIIAIAELVSVTPSTQARIGVWWDSPRGRRYDYHATGNELAFGDYSAGRYAWLLADVRVLPEPIPARGALGLWEWTPPEGVEL